jgi:hypothetical protein
MKGWNMQILYWIGIAFAVFYTGAYWWDRFTRPIDFVWSWPLGIAVFAIYYGYKYWRDRRDAQDAHEDMRGKQPDPSDE